MLCCALLSYCMYYCSSVISSTFCNVMQFAWAWASIIDTTSSRIQLHCLHFSKMMYLCVCMCMHVSFYLPAFVNRGISSISFHISGYSVPSPKVLYSNSNSAIFSVSSGAYSSSLRDQSGCYGKFIACVRGTV